MCIQTTFFRYPICTRFLKSTSFFIRFLVHFILLSLIRRNYKHPSDFRPIKDIKASNLARIQTIRLRIHEVHVPQFSLAMKIHALMNEQTKALLLLLDKQKTKIPCLNHGKGKHTGVRN
jgi:hypothetical protein